MQIHISELKVRWTVWQNYRIDENDGKLEESNALFKMYCGTSKNKGRATTLILL